MTQTAPGCQREQSKTLWLKPWEDPVDTIFAGTCHAYLANSDSVFLPGDRIRLTELLYTGSIGRVAESFVVNSETLTFLDSGITSKDSKGYATWNSLFVDGLAVLLGFGHSAPAKAVKMFVEAKVGPITSWGDQLNLITWGPLDNDAGD